MRIGTTPILRDIQRVLRRRRLEKFLSRFNLQKSWRILDIGGTVPTWMQPQLAGVSANLLNLFACKIPESEKDRLQGVAGDATNLHYDDDAFDLAFSNSVIEHVGTWENQVKFAAEMRRVAPRIWMQTPARCFFFEPHYVSPFIHWIPRKHRGKFVRWFTVWGLATRPTKQQVQDRIDEIRLLNYKEVCQLFPDCEIIRERVLGMTKSYVAVREQRSKAGGE